MHVQVWKRSNIRGKSLAVVKGYVTASTVMLRGLARAANQVNSMDEM
jgi:hypothetical protein